MTKYALCLLAVIGAGGCDPNATATGQPAAEPVKTSAVYESCNASQSCDGALRCIDGVCLAGERSRLGDYHAAVGQRAIVAGAISEAVTAYNAAVTQYEQEDLEVPTDVFCAQGRALTASRMDPQKAEAAARVLHRCLLGMPAGSALYDQALDDLAVLGEVGLEPKLLTRAQPADLYLTRQPKKPPLDNLSLTVTGDSKASRSTYQKFLEVLGTDDAKARLAPCWEAHWKETREETMTATLPFSYHLRLDPDDASGDKAFIELGKVEEPGDQAAAAAQNCVRGVAEEIAADLAKQFKQDQRWKSNITIALGTD